MLLLPHAALFHLHAFLLLCGTIDSAIAAQVAAPTHTELHPEHVLHCLITADVFSSQIHRRKHLIWKSYNSLKKKFYF